MKKPELLAPAGNLERLVSAIEAGADACYIGGIDFSLRAIAEGVDKDFLLYAIDYVKSKNKKLYFTLNLFPHNRHIEKSLEIINFLSEIEIDAVIVSDIGLITYILKHYPKIELHLSTQANTTNILSVKFYEDIGIKRVNLARELTLQEIKEIREKTNIELEVFIHGAMCISYSGRCLISRYLTKRSANLGGCPNCCRFNYYIIEIYDPKSKKYLEVREEKEGTAILASEDLMTLPILDKIIDTGVDSLKIEGRTKSSFYVNTVVSIYRKAIDNIFEGKKDFYSKEDVETLLNLSPRGTFTGFYDDNVEEYYIDKKKMGEMSVGQVREKTSDLHLVDVRMPFKVGDILFAYNSNVKKEVEVEEMYDIFKNSKKQAHPNDIVWIRFSKDIPKGTILRKKANWF